MEDRYEENLEPTNEIVEIEDDKEIVYDTIENEAKVKKNKKKKNRKSSRLSKKQKIIIICVTIGIVLIIGILLLYFLVFKKEEEKEKEPEVVLVKENYRYEDGVLIFLDDSKNELGKYTCENKDEDKCFIAKYSGEDDFYEVKKVYRNNKGIEEVSDIFLNRYVLISDNATLANNVIILYDIKEGKEIGKYLLAKKIDDNNLILENTDELYGVMNLTSKEASEVIEFKYNYLGKMASNDNIVAKSNNEAFILDLEGKELSKKIIGDIKNYNDSYISILDNDTNYIYDYEGKKVIDKDCNYITFKDDYIIMIDGKRLYVYDKDLNLLNYEGIKISSSNYDKKIVFDEDLKEIERVEDFNIEIGNNTISINDKDNITEINIYEGTFNNKLKYVSYYNGILYIFKDEKKETLLGSYECSTLNSITKTTNSLDNCFIASEEKLLNREKDGSKLGLLPVFNEKYVFIKDGDEIILWDLKAKKDNKKATYLAVDAGYYNDSKDLGFVSSANTIVMAKNTSGNFGLIKIEASNVTGLIGFKDSNNGGDTKAIKIVGDNYLVTRDKNYLYSRTGKLLGTSSSEIVAANNSALLVKSTNGYTVTDLKGSIIKADLVYAELKDNYFVAIDSNNMLNVYNYSSYSTGLLSSSVYVSTKENYSSCYVIKNNTITIEGVEYSLSLSSEEEDAN